MLTGSLALFLSVFLACAVEAVEATTIVLAAGTARNWRSALTGASSALVLLVIIIAAFGPAISQLPIDGLRLFVGALLLVFGLQWVRKAILRSSGYKSLHDEDAIFNEELQAARQAKSGSRFGVTDWYAFTLSFKGVLLEGLEVAFIVLTFGTIQGEVILASFSALTAVVIVVIAGFALRKPLAKVPENSMKYVVGIMLTSFGIFWGAEGAGAEWPGKDLSLVGIIIFMLIISNVLIKILKVQNSKVSAIIRVTEKDELDTLEILNKSGVAELIKKFGAFWFDFLIGDDWRGTVIVLAAFILTHRLASENLVSWWVLPLGIVILLPYNLFRVTKAKKS
ncbi:MAG: hypothetical protein WCI68_02985 [Actinomycetes bacterium]